MHVCQSQMCLTKKSRLLRLVVSFFQNNIVEKPYSKLFSLTLSLVCVVIDLLMNLIFYDK